MFDCFFDKASWVYTLFVGRLTIILNKGVGHVEAHNIMTTIVAKIYGYIMGGGGGGVGGVGWGGMGCGRAFGCLSTPLLAVAYNLFTLAVQYMGHDTLLPLHIPQLRSSCPELPYESVGNMWAIGVTCIV